MEIQLFGKSTIREVQRQFSKFFPLLKMEFFKHTYRKGDASGVSQKLNDHTTLSELKQMRKEGRFSFTPSTPVAAFEQQMQEEFGLPVQVFRKVGEGWIETTQTGNLSLEKQDAMAKEATKSLRFNINTLFL